MKSFSQLFLAAQDCSSITDSDLHDIVNPKSDRFLPDSNGIYTIYYGFDLEYKLDGFEDKTVTISRNYDEFVYSKIPQDSHVRTMIEVAMQSWVDLSGGKIQFKKEEGHETGIHYFFTTNRNLIRHGASAYCSREMNNNNVIVIPESIGDFTARSAGHGTLLHEIGHALGFDHMHEKPAILTKLKNLRHGEDCSVINYNALVRSNNYRWLASDTGRLGTLDKRLLGLAYTSIGNATLLTTEGFEMQELKSAFEMAMLTAIFYLIHNRLNANQKLSSAALDAFVVTLSFLTEYPVLPLTLFSIAEISRLAFSNQLEKIPGLNLFAKNYFNIGTFLVFTAAMSGTNGYNAIFRTFLSIILMGLMHGVGYCLDNRADATSENEYADEFSDVLEDNLTINNVIEIVDEKSEANTLESFSSKASESRFFATNKQLPKRANFAVAEQDNEIEALIINYAPSV